MSGVEVFTGDAERALVGITSGVGAAIYVGHPIPVGVLYASAGYLLGYVVHIISDKALTKIGVGEQTRKIINLAAAFFVGTLGTWKGLSLAGKTISFQSAIYLNTIAFGVFATILLGGAIFKMCLDNCLPQEDKKGFFG